MFFLIIYIKKNKGNAQSSVAEYYITEVGLCIALISHVSLYVSSILILRPRRTTRTQSHYDSFCCAKHWGALGAAYWDGPSGRTRPLRPPIGPEWQFILNSRQLMCSIFKIVTRVLTPLHRLDHKPSTQTNGVGVCLRPMDYSEHLGPQEVGQQK